MAKSTRVEAARHDPVWISDVKMPKFTPLRENLQTDVCVVGAGIAGLTTAYLSLKAGRSVVVLDDGTVGGGMTTVTTAHLASAIDDRFFEVERIRGEEGARQAAESHAAAIDRIEQIVAEEKIDCDFHRVDGYLFPGPDQDADLLQRELDTALRIGLPVQFLGRVPWPSFDTGPCLRFPRQGQFHPLKYLAGLAEAITNRGGKIFTETHADKIEGGGFARVTAGKHHVKSTAVVVATNSPINDLVAIHTKQAPYMTYVIAGRIPAGSVPLALYWDMEDPYHYVRLSEGPQQDGHKDFDVLIIGGEDHKTGQADDTQLRHARLETWARARFPQMGEIEYVWGGQVMETIDGLAFIGRNPLDEDNVYIATGDSGMGMTHGTIAGMLLTDLIIGRHNRFVELYEPSRRPPFALASFLKENANVALQYFDWLTGSEMRLEEIPNGSGAVLRRGLSKVAVYRDEKGEVHECSAVCPHLQCIVEWNAAEETWDCPCHGSRFDKQGRVINGPANSDLAPIEAEEKAESHAK